MDNKKFEVLQIADKIEWEEKIKKSFFYDIYHTHFYHSFESCFQSLLFTSEYNNEIISIPFKLIPIEDTGYSDLTSVYGYCGPISTHQFSEISPEHKLYFKKKFVEFCKKNNVVSVFSRLHPLNNYDDFFENFGNISELNKTVVIDLHEDEKVQVKEYRKSTRYEISQLRKNSFEIVETRDANDINYFIDMYYKTMIKVSAYERYYFDKSYFHGLLNNEDYEVKLLMAKKDDEFIAGAIFTIAGNIMQYHLATTDEKYIKHAPMKLIIDEARKIAKTNGLKYLHLGGGFAGRDDDSLFLFKAGFSKKRERFYVWKFIIDINQYNKLVQYKNLKNKVNTFFPLYRS